MQFEVTHTKGNASLVGESKELYIYSCGIISAFVADEHVSHTYARGDVSHTYARGAGRIPDKRPCPEGLRDDGVSCWRDAHIYGKGCCCTIWGCCKNKCKSGYHDDGCTCRRTDIGIKVALWERQYCRDDEEKRGALCYPKCKAGYTPVGCCLCETVQE